jgi:hypothetical protein
MTNRRLPLVASLSFVVVAIVCVRAIVLAMLPPTPSTLEANFRRIEDGMTLKEVETIFDGPGKSTGGGFRRNIGSYEHRHLEVWAWKNDNGQWAVVEFTDGRVSYKEWSSFR